MRPNVKLLMLPYDKYPIKPPADPPNSSPSLFSKVPPCDMMLPLFEQYSTRAVRRFPPTCSTLPAMPPACAFSDVTYPTFAQYMTEM